MEPAILKKDVLRQHRAPCPIQDGKLLQLRLFSEQRCVDCELRTASALRQVLQNRRVIRQSFTSRRSFCRNSTARISPPSSAQSKSPLLGRAVALGALEQRTAMRFFPLRRKRVASNENGV